MAVLKGLNSGVALALELAMLAAFGYWGFEFGQGVWMKWGLALGIPLLVIVLWGRYFAPKSRRRLPLLPGAGLSLALFLASAAALYAAHQAPLALGRAAVAVINRGLVLAWRQW